MNRTTAISWWKRTATIRGSAQDDQFHNTSLEWNGKTWATVVLPLSSDKHPRLDLITHELFHCAQPSLGFDMRVSDNHHLDEKDGRVLLRLEIEALKKALKARRALSGRGAFEECASLQEVQAPGIQRFANLRKQA